MKVLYTNFHEGSGGGHTTYVRELAKGLVADHEIHVAAPAGSRLLEEAAAIPGVQVFAQSFPNGLRRGKWNARSRLKTYLRAHDFDIIHVNGSADHRLVMAAVSGLPRKPHIVLTKHNTKSLKGLQHVWRAWRGTDKVIAVCDFVRNQLLDTPYRRCAPETVYNGVDTCAFSPWSVEAAAAERLMLCPDGAALLIGSSAGTSDYKGWTDLVAALQLLDAPERQQIRIAIAGHAPSESQRRLIAQAGLEHNFIFPGLLADVRPMIAALDAGFVLSHDVETISFACREMMAMGKPVMVTRYGGLPENIHEDKDGWVVPVHGVEAMAARIRWMLNERRSLESMGRQAREHAASEFGIQHFVTGTSGVYDALMQSSAR